MPNQGYTHESVLNYMQDYLDTLPIKVARMAKIIVLNDKIYLLHEKFGYKDKL